MKLYSDPWWVGCYIWFSEDDSGRSTHPATLLYICTQWSRSSSVILLLLTIVGGRGALRPSQSCLGIGYFHPEATQTDHRYMSHVIGWLQANDNKNELKKSRAVGKNGNNNADGGGNATAAQHMKTAKWQYSVHLTTLTSAL